MGVVYLGKLSFGLFDFRGCSGSRLFMASYRRVWPCVGVHAFRGLGFRGSAV